MQSAYFKKLTVLFLLLVFIFTSAQNVFAQTNELTNLERLRLDTTDPNYLSPNKFVQNINKEPYVLTSDYIEIVENISSISPGVASNESLNGLLDRVAQGGQSSAGVRFIKRATGNLLDNDFDSSFANNIIQNYSAGNISERIAASLTIIENPVKSFTEIEAAVGVTRAEELNKILTTFASAENFDSSALNDILQGVIYDGFSDLSTEEYLQRIATYSDFLKDAKNVVKDPKVFTDLAKKFADGSIPIELTDILKGSLDKLDEFKDLADPKKLLEELGINKVFDEFKDDIDKLLEGVAGIAEITKIVKAIEELDIKELFNNLPDGIKDALIEALGSEEAAIAALEALLGDGEDTPDPTEGCGSECSSCDDCGVPINTNHIRIRSHVTSQFEQHRTWIVTEFFIKHIAPAMAKMNSQLITVGTQQIQAIGQFFDAKHQLETQRLFQTMTARAHKDYHPSEGLCKIGTSSVSLAGSQRISDLSQSVMAEQMMNRQLATADTMAGGGRDRDRRSRLNLFIENFCNKTDHGGGLQKLCKNSNPDPAQINMDVDYTNAFNNKLTLQFDPLDTGDEPITKDEQNLYGLSSNLFANQILPTFSESELVKNGKPTYKVQNLLDMRSVAAKRSVAINSFTAIAAQKAEGDDQAAPFLKAILAETGVSPQDIENRLGKRPSYYAQMEVLTKDIYQSPEFYANLYDKPANVNRKAVALLALELMQDRDIYDSLLRSEAVLATMIELLIRDEHTRVTENLGLVGTTGPAYRGPATAPTEPVVGPQ